MDPKPKGIFVGIIWFFVVGFLASMSSLVMVFMHSGGVSSPSAFFGLVLATCAFGTPPLLALAGIPLAYQIYHDRPAMKFGLVTLGVSFAVFMLSWIAPIVARGF